MDTKPIEDAVRGANPIHAWGRASKKMSQAQALHKRQTGDA
ncbi:hypothetical protein AMC99_01891 [Altererythrobacter epoxidivorans]|uniref:Uncharacterized protein n=1 Tax=Altererythrobacter epoxidivorans TaxID=361183 RepID=A0A0M4LVJ3_9SPHN|nr:hypothetical protein AMC99_01891 [Altererythrobacter epoxidivorans]